MNVFKTAETAEKTAWLIDLNFRAIITDTFLQFINHNLFTSINTLTFF